MLPSGLLVRMGSVLETQQKQHCRVPPVSLGRGGHKCPIAPATAGTDRAVSSSNAAARRWVVH